MDFCFWLCKSFPGNDYIKKNILKLNILRSECGIHILNTVEAEIYLGDLILLFSLVVSINEIKPMTNFKRKHS